MKKKLYHSVLIATLAIFGLSNPGNAQTIAGGYQHSLSLCNDGIVRAWGDNTLGLLGIGMTPNKITIPTAINSLTSIIAIEGGAGSSLALKSDGTVWAWGSNYSGQLGNGNNASSTVPVQVNFLTGITAISVHSDYCLALKNDGTVWSWGENDYGQLGNGNNTDSNVPLLVSSLSGITSIATGRSHSFAIKNDGTVWGWGSNYYGQLGMGTFTNSYNTPVQVSALTGVIAFALSAYTTLAIKSDGTLLSCGSNSDGELGIGTYTYSNVPVQVTSLTGIAAISGGQFHFIALKNDGTIWTWGKNTNGQLGNGNFATSNIPVQVTSLTGITSIAAGSGGSSHSLAMKNNGTAWAWGNNGYGQLGIGNFTDSNVPVQVTGLCGGTSAIQENLIANSISVYPNPSNDFITIENKNGQLISPYAIINCLGQQIVTGKLTTEKTSIDISGLREGFYLLQVGEAKKQSFKLIKK